MAFLIAVTIVYLLISYSDVHVHNLLSFSS